MSVQSTLAGVALLLFGSVALSRAQNAPSKYFVREDTRLWQANGRRELLHAIDGSLRVVRSRRAATTYARLAQHGLSRTRVQRSLMRFRQLLLAARSPQQLETALQREFVFVRLAPQTHFTGYFEPIYQASRVRTTQYRYPLFRAPNLRSWPRPHPTRLQLEGANGLQVSPLLQGREIVWLHDRLEAYLAQVEGSVRVRLTDGRTLNLSYAAHTNWPYTSLGRELRESGAVPGEQLTQPELVEYFRRNPQQLSVFLPRNRRFVFFRERPSTTLTGSFGVPLVAERSMALDGMVLPPGALAIAQIDFQKPIALQFWKSPRLTRFVFGHDQGGAIKGNARIDLFLGTGQQAGNRAGVINSMGQLYFLLLRA